MNFLPDAGPGCYIARRELSPPWLIEWEDIDPEEFEGEEVPDIAIDVEEQTLSLCNVDNITKVAYVTVFDTKVLSCDGKVMKQGSSTDNKGNETPCVTFIVLCPPRLFVHLCFLVVPDGQDITQTRIDSDVQAWEVHPNPEDEHPQKIGFPLSGGPFVCTQGEGGVLTHFFSGNLHAIDFRCPVGTPLLAVADGSVIESTDKHTLTGIAVSNLFEWNSIVIKLDACSAEPAGGPLFVEYVHIKKSTVMAGDRVKRGQVIGFSGSVGFSPEPHLHFSAFRSSERAAPTVRVNFETETGGSFLPKAGNWYGVAGAIDKP